METYAAKTPGDSSDPIDRPRGGDRGALAALFAKHRDPFTQPSPLAFY